MGVYTQCTVCTCPCTNSLCRMKIHNGKYSNENNDRPADSSINDAQALHKHFLFCNRNVSEVVKSDTLGEVMPRNSRPSPPFLERNNFFFILLFLKEYKENKKCRNITLKQSVCMTKCQVALNENFLFMPRNFRSVRSWQDTL